MRKRGLETYYNSAATPAGERRMLEHAYGLASDPKASAGYKASVDKWLTSYRRRKERAARTRRSASPAPGRSEGRVYVYPNPTGGQDALIRVETVDADGVEIVVRSLGGREVLKATLSDGVVKDTQDGPRRVYEHRWDKGRAAAGVYVVEARARKGGAGDVTMSCKMAVTP